MTARDATRELIRDVAETVDARALAAFNLDPDTDVDAIIDVGRDAEVTEALRRLYVGTDLDARGVEDYAAHNAMCTVQSIAATPPNMLLTVLTGHLRLAFLVGYHVHAEQARRDA